MKAVEKTDKMVYFSNSFWVEWNPDETWGSRILQK